MAEKRGKFSALADLHRQPPEAETSELVIEQAPSPAVLPGGEKSRGRPAVGKRSNPEWRLYSHYLKRKTQRAAVARLQAQDNGRDLSDILQELLETWVASNT